MEIPLWKGLKIRLPCNLVSLTFMATHDKAKEQGRQARDQTAKAVESNLGTDGDSSVVSFHEAPVFARLTDNQAAGT